MRRISVAILCLVLLATLFALPYKVLSQTPTPPSPQNSSDSPSPQELKEIQEKIAELQKKLAEIADQKRTLSSQITYMDSQISLTNLKIEETQARIIQSGQEIASLSAKIEKLEISLTGLSEVLLKRIAETYKRGDIESWQLILSSQGFSDLLARAKYIRTVQVHDKRLMYQLAQAKATYQEQKNLLEEKKREDEKLKKELDGYKVTLARQKAEKVRFLEITKNDEKRYQELLAKARAEQEAIQSIIAGKGQEEEVGSVSEGQKIATLISGESCNSQGTHLHFIVSKNNVTENPFNYLKPGVDYENCSGSGYPCGTVDTDPFNPSGSWNWPIEPKIKLVQGYGATWATRNDPFIKQIYSFHNGIDIVNSSLDVKAVKEGILYRGSYTGSNGCRLRYVRIKHKDDGLETFYLHVN